MHVPVEATDKVGLSPARACAAAPPHLLMSLEDIIKLLEEENEEIYFLWALNSRN